MTVDRPVIEVPTPTGGWADPWPNVAEIESVLPHEYWTLVGGLMVQLHGITQGIKAIRPTNDVDIVVHVETGRGRPRTVADTLFALGYELLPSIDPRTRTAHRFRRGASTIDVVTSQSTTREVVDVLMADHAAPSVATKSAAHRADSRDPERHLQDAAVLFACIEAPYAQHERESSGSDRRRLLYLRKHLADVRHPAWLSLTEGQRSDGLSALDVLTR